MTTLKVITVALKSELPQDFLKEKKIPVYSLQNLPEITNFQSKSNLFSENDFSLLVFLTGVGPTHSKKSAEWVAEHLKPKLVLNIGTAGYVGSDKALSDWVTPNKILNAEGEALEVLTNLDFLPRKTQDMLKLKTANMFSISTPGQYTNVMQGFNDYAIDMEAFEQAKVFRNAHIAFNAIKWISDLGLTPPTVKEFKEKTKIFRKVFEDLLRSAFVC